jgi:hypothetical protein
VLGRFTTWAHGADIPGLRLGFVSSTPIPAAIEAPARPEKSGYVRDLHLQFFTVAGLLPREGIESEIRDAFAGPSHDECSIIIRKAGDAAAKLIEKLRTSLGVPPLAAVSLIEFLSKALAGGGEWSNILIHTTYFNEDKVLNRIKCVISPEGAAADDRPIAACAHDSPERLASADWPPRGFFWWTVRCFIRALIAFTPVLVLFIAGIAILYPQSNDAQVRWASSAPVGLNFLIRDAQLDSYPLIGGFVWYTIASEVRPDSAADLDAAVARSANPDTLATVRKSRVKLLRDSTSSSTIAAEKQRIVGPVAQDEALSLAIQMFDCSISCLPAQGEDVAQPVQLVLNHLGEIGRRELVTNVTSEQAETIGTAVAGLSDRLGYKPILKTQWSNIHEILQALLVVDRLLAESGFQRDANKVLNEALKIQTLLVSVPKNNYLIRDYVSLSLACRWPVSRVRQCEELLGKAETLANAEPNLRQRLVARSFVAAGYARIGRFHIARELCEGAADYSTFIVASQILARTYESQRFINQVGATPFATTRAMVTWAFLGQGIDWISSPDRWIVD